MIPASLPNRGILLAERQRLERYLAVMAAHSTCRNYVGQWRKGWDWPEWHSHYEG